MSDELEQTGAQSKLNDWYDRNIRGVVVFCLAVSVLGVVLGLSSIRTDQQQNADRDRDLAAQAKQRDQLLACIDDRDAYVAEQNRKLRKFTQRRDDLANEAIGATVAKEQALVDWTGFLLVALAAQGQGDPEESTRQFVKTTEALNHAAMVMQRAELRLFHANERLKAARDKNPVVPAASVVCATGKFQVPSPSPSPTNEPSGRPQFSPSATPSTSESPHAAPAPSAATSSPLASATPQPAPSSTRTSSADPTPAPSPSSTGLLAAVEEEVRDLIGDLVP